MVGYLMPIVLTLSGCTKTCECKQDLTEPLHGYSITTNSAGDLIGNEAYKCKVGLDYYHKEAKRKWKKYNTNKDL